MNINLLNEAQLQLFRQLLERAENIVLCCHKGPDGDAIGSTLAMADYLVKIGKKATVVIPDAMPDFLSWLNKAKQVLRYDRQRILADELIKKADLVFCMDFNTTDRLADLQASIDACNAPFILIDHHLNPNVNAELAISHPSLCSTSEIVFRLIYQLGGIDKISKNCAEAIYCGMMTDTGAFTYNSNYPEIFYIIGLLLTKGIDKDKIYRSVYNNFSESCMRMRGYVISQKMQVLPECHAAYFTLTKNEMKQFNFIKGDAEGLVNEPLRIKGMRLSISLREDTEKENLIWVSLRSVDEFYCNKIAEKYFNGGGHANAAGGKLFCSMEEAEQT